MTEELLEKKRDSARTKMRILNAAIKAFSERGYAQAGLRDIAAEAGINVALIRRYYGSKEGLFREALSNSLDVSVFSSGKRGRFGETVVRSFLERNEDRANPLSMLILSTADPEAKAVALELLEKLVIGPISGWIGTDDGYERAARISILCSGFFLYRDLLPIKGPADPIDPLLRAWLVASLQAVIDE